MKTSKTKFFVFALIAAILVSFTALSLTGCLPEEEDDSTDPDKKTEDFKIEGEYHFVNDTNKATYNWEFKADKTFNIEWKVAGNDRSKTGTYSVSGADVTLKLDPESGVTFPSEVFTASKSGEEVTLKLKDDSAMTSMIFSGALSVVSKSLTLTEGKASLEPPEETYGSYRYRIVENGSKKTVTITGFDLELSDVTVETISFTNSNNATVTVQFLTLNIPSKINGLDVTVIGENAFPQSQAQIDKLNAAYPSPPYLFDGRIHGLVIPSTVTRIENGNFGSGNYSGLLKITIGAGVDFPNDFQGLYGLSTVSNRFLDYYKTTFSRQAGTYHVNYNTVERKYVWEKQ
jgi:hypothetical protein